jgi:signal transduction histidine kinase
MNSFLIRIYKCIFGALTGAIILSVFSTIQKLFAHYPVKLSGFYVPIIFGGIVGIILCQWRAVLKKKEQELREAKTKAEESNRLKSEFLANLSHEVRTPLNSIMGFSQLITKDNLSTETRKQYCHIILSRADDFLHIMENILLISEIETNQVKAIRREFKLSSLINEIITYTEYHELKISNKNSFHIQYPENMENMILHTDIKLITQVLKRVIHNAFKFTVNGKVQISIYNCSDYIEFTVEDNGIGIDQSNHNIIFEKFRQIDGSQTRTYGGCGLGLSIAMGITQILKGDLSLQAEIDKGTKVIINLPKEIQLTDVKPAIEIGSN